MTTIRLLLSTLLLLPLSLLAQENYEIQVYDSKTTDPGVTIVELHSNYTLHGFAEQTSDGVAPTNHAFHETIEITHGFNSWFEVGFYQFMTINAGQNPAYVGNHIRPRFRVPDSYNLPVGLSLSTELGYQRAEYAGDNWSLEVRPIVDKIVGRWDVSINPVVGVSLKCPSGSQSPVFSPNVKVSFEACKLFNTGLEYYNSMGTFQGFNALNQQPHQLVWAFDFHFSPKWELNVGYAHGLNSSVERDIIKCYIGRRFGK